MNKEYQAWMTKKFETVIVSVSPSNLEWKEIRKEYESRTGSTNPYDFPEIDEEIKGKYRHEITLKNVSLTEAQEFAEPIRIANPDQGVSITADKSLIGNTTWNDQMKMFWEYPVFTKIGEQFKQARITEAKEKNLIASWE